MKIYQVCNLRTARCLYFLPPSVGDLKTTVQENYLQKTRFKSFLLKGIFSGLGSIIIGLCIGERLTVLWSIIPVLFGRIYRIRIEYIFLCLRSKASRCGTDKCLLRNFSVYSSYSVIDYIQANSYGYLFYSINFYGNRCLAFFK